VTSIAFGSSISQKSSDAIAASALGEEASSAAGAALAYGTR